MKVINTVAAAMALYFLLPGLVFAGLPRIDDARVIQPPPGAKVAAAYFTITNSTSDVLEITDAHSDVANKVEVHLSFVENDVARMEKQASVKVEAGESLEFRHGSFHVMFMGLKQELAAGNTLALTLTTSAGDIDIAVPVISLDDAMSRQGMNRDGGADGGMGSDKHSLQNEAGADK